MSAPSDTAQRLSALALKKCGSIALDRPGALGSARENLPLEQLFVMPYVSGRGVVTLDQEDIDRISAILDRDNEHFSKALDLLTNAASSTRSDIDCACSRILFIGPTGSGKTMLSKRVATYLADIMEGGVLSGDELETEALRCSEGKLELARLRGSAPIFIECKSLWQSDESLCERLARAGLSETSRVDGITSGIQGLVEPCCVIVDGLDQLPNSVAPEELVEAIEKVFGGSRRKLSIVITSRPYSSSSESDGLVESFARIGFEVYFIKGVHSLENSEIDFVGSLSRKWIHAAYDGDEKAETIAKRFLASYKGMCSRGESHLISTPFDLVALLRVFSQYEVLPQNRFVLYERLAQARCDYASGSGAASDLLLLASYVAFCAAVDPKAVSSIRSIDGAKSLVLDARNALRGRLRTLSDKRLDSDEQAVESDLAALVDAGILAHSLDDSGFEFAEKGLLVWFVENAVAERALPASLKGASIGEIVEAVSLECWVTSDWERFLELLFSDGRLVRHRPSMLLALVGRLGSYWLPAVVMDVFVSEVIAGRIHSLGLEEDEARRLFSSFFGGEIRSDNLGSVIRFVRSGLCVEEHSAIEEAYAEMRVEGDSFAYAAVVSLMDAIHVLDIVQADERVAQKDERGDLHEVLRNILSLGSPMRAVEALVSLRFLKAFKNEAALEDNVALSALFEDGSRADDLAGVVCEQALERLVSLGDSDAERIEALRIAKCLATLLEHTVCRDAFIERVFGMRRHIRCGNTLGKGVIARKNKGPRSSNRGQALLLAPLVKKCEESILYWKSKGRSRLKNAVYYADLLGVVASYDSSALLAVQLPLGQARIISDRAVRAVFYIARADEDNAYDLDESLPAWDATSFFPDLLSLAVNRTSVDALAEHDQLCAAASVMTLASCFVSSEKERESFEGQYNKAAECLRLLSNAIGFVIGEDSTFLRRGRSLDVALGGSPELGLRRSSFMEGERILFTSNEVDYAGRIERINADGRRNVWYGNSFTYLVEVIGSVSKTKDGFLLVETVRHPYRMKDIPESALQRFDTGGFEQAVQRFEKQSKDTLQD